MPKVKLSNNFYMHEFKCGCSKHCRGSNPKPPLLLVEIAELIRQKVNERVDFEFRMKITSAFRCIMHNFDEGGSKTSQHKSNTAIDFRDLHRRVDVETLRYCAIEALADMYVEGGVGIYNTFVHVDIRGYTARWDMR